MADPHDPFEARATLPGGEALYRLDRIVDPLTLPYTVCVLLENLLRRTGSTHVREEDVRALAAWPQPAPDAQLAFMPARVLMQDLTGVPAVVDLAALRAAVARRNGDPGRVDPLVPVDLVIDHSVQVDAFGSDKAYARNIEREYERNGERYQLLRWAQGAFQNFRVVPPGMGICHQVNLEYLGQVVRLQDGVAFPDTLVGTDSHTTMINSIGVLGWGVGGIEAEAVMLGQPLYMIQPQVIGVRMTGALPEGATATDLVLTVTQMLREKGVVGKFVEYYGEGLANMPLADRATIGNMSPEYGATCGIFPVDAETLRYLEFTGRPKELVALVEAYTKEQGLFHDESSEEATYSDTLELDMSTVEPSLAGPKRPQDRVRLSEAHEAFAEALASDLGENGHGHELHARDESSAESFPASDPPTGSEGDTDPDAGVKAPVAAVAESPVGTPVKLADGSEFELFHGAVVIAAITSCTNTSNPTVMIGAGLLAKNAVERGLARKPWVKTSLAPGSKVVTEYLDKAGLTEYLEQLQFNLVGYGCTTCIGNSGPLPPEISEAVTEADLSVCSVLSGNRNFEGRIHPEVKMNYLTSPPLVVAYALAGTVDIDLAKDPIGTDPNGQPVYLADIWPTRDEVEAVVAENVTSEMFQEEYATVFDGDDRWKTLPVPTGELYHWDSESTYVQEPPYFIDMSPQPQPVQDITGARVLVLVGDSVTTDHISPAGAIARTSPAAQYLVNNDVEPRDFNSYGSRRGNHEVMVRGTFANIRLRNQLVPDKEGNLTVYLPTGEEMSIYDASYLYQRDNIPLLAIAGKEYGSGSSRDWAAKGPMLLGIKAIIAESYERIHRSNLVGMGVLPLQFKPGENLTTFGLDGTETFAISGIADNLTPHKVMTVTATTSDGSSVSFEAVARIDSKVEVGYYKNGGILQTVLRRLMTS